MTCLRIEGSALLGKLPFILLGAPIFVARRENGGRGNMACGHKSMKPWLHIASSTQCSSRRTHVSHQVMNRPSKYDTKKNWSSFLFPNQQEIQRFLLLSSLSLLNCEGMRILHLASKS